MPRERPRRGTSDDDVGLAAVLYVPTVNGFFLRRAATSCHALAGASYPICDMHEAQNTSSHWWLTQHRHSVLLPQHHSANTIT
jgi:hypothetical protein